MIKSFLLLYEWKIFQPIANKSLSYFSNDFVTAVNEQANNAVLLLYSSIALQKLKTMTPADVPTLSCIEFYVHQWILIDN